MIKEDAARKKKTTSTQEKVRRLIARKKRYGDFGKFSFFSSSRSIFC
jgi:hypothetical protein